MTRAVSVTVPPAHHRILKVEVPAPAAVLLAPKVHRKIVPALTAAFNEIWEKCGKDQAKVDKTGASDFGGCFNIRQIAGSNSYSNHSWAMAIDLSPAMNGFNMKSTLSSIVVDAFKRQGAFWGGDYKGRKDPMHFEFVSR